MRGKAYQQILPFSKAGITPAYAGKSSHQGRPATYRRDHPRLCGEKLPVTLQSVSPVGSPPPMRGKGDICIAADTGVGITPAYAGKR